MDGFQGQMTQSMQFRLSAWLSAVILVVAVAAGILSFVTSFEEAIEMQDDQLRQTAALMNRLSLPVALAPTQSDDPQSEPEARIVVQILPPPGVKGPRIDAVLAGLPFDLPDGIQTVEVHGLSWRVFVKSLDSGSRIVIGQQTDERDEIAYAGAWRTVVPLLILVPVLLLVLHGLLHKIFRPIANMAADLDQRPDQDLGNVPHTNIPSEILPFVNAINRQLSRVAQAVTAQRRFLADAAHELRSPLGALSLQAERLQAADIPLHARPRLEALRGGIRRTRILLDQLLSLARAQESSGKEPKLVSVQSVFRQVLEELMPLAEAKNIDLGVVAEGDVAILGNELDLTTLVKNLVENAIHYTPAGGRIDLRVQARADSVILQVDDTGPGIPAEERELVFDPFYRILGTGVAGSGLGLSIVRAIAQRSGAQVNLGHSNEKTQTGLRARVTFPRREILGA